MQMPASLHVLALASLLAATGCAVPGSPPVVAECSLPAAPQRLGPALVGQAYGMSMTALPLNSVQFGSHAAARMVAVQHIYAARTPADTVQLDARLLSCGDAPQALRMRVQFMRADMSPAEPPSAWRTLLLTPRTTALYSERSVARDATAYLIEVIE